MKYLMKVSLCGLTVLLSSCGSAPSFVEGSVEFVIPLTQEETLQLAQEYDLRAYTVYATMGDGAGVANRVTPDEAGAYVISDALEKVRAFKSTSFSSFPPRAAGLLNAIEAQKLQQVEVGSSDQLAFFLRQGKALLQRAEVEGKVQLSLQGNPAFIYGLDFVTDSDDFKRFSQAELGKVKRGIYRPSLGRTVVDNPQVDLEAKRAPQRNMTSIEIERGLKALAEQKP